MIEQPPTTQAPNAHYQVQLPVFSGPMELLLHLIERRELDITVVSLAAVTDQYLGYVQSMTEPDPDQIADFLVVAAKLLAIKARALIARPAERAVAEEEEEDAEDLVRALREYQLFKRAAAQLKTWTEEQRRSYARMVRMAPMIRAGAPEDLSLDALISALRARLAVVPPEATPPSIAAPVYTVSDKITAIESALAREASVKFGDLLPLSAPAVEVIVTFLALLELLKARRVTVAQSAIFGKIEIAWNIVTVAPNGC